MEPICMLHYTVRPATVPCTFLLQSTNYAYAIRPTDTVIALNGTVAAHYSGLRSQIRLNVIQMTSGYDTPLRDVVENLLPFGSVRKGES